MESHGVYSSASGLWPSTPREMRPAPHRFLLCSAVGGYSGCFWVWAAVNTAATGDRVPVFQEIHARASVGLQRRGGTAGEEGRPTFGRRRRGRFPFSEAVVPDTLPWAPGFWESQLFYTLNRHAIFSRIFILAILAGV